MPRAVKIKAKAENEMNLTPVADIRTSQQITKRSGTGSTIFPVQEEGVYVVSRWISLVLLEPLTGERIWIKKVEVNPFRKASFGNIL
jgi:hypothetical protein